jgi:hypothetical protein
MKKHVIIGGVFFAMTVVGAVMASNSNEYLYISLPLLVIGMVGLFFTYVNSRKK